MVRSIFSRALRLTALVLLGGVGAATVTVTVDARAEDRALRSVPVPVPYVELQAQKYFPGGTGQAPAARIFRLTREQIDATVKALLPAYFKVSVKTVMARDALQTNYEYAELLSINAANFGELTGWIGDIAARVRARPSGVIDCAAGDPACQEKAALGFVMRAFRGDVDIARLKEIVDFYRTRVKDVGFAMATGDLVEVTLNSPSFLFRKEIDGEPDRAIREARRLATLTYTLGDAPPDAFGFEAGGAAQLFASRFNAAATLDRIVTAPAARAKMKRFFTAWLELKEPADFTISPNYFPAFNPKLASDMLAETDRFLEAQLGKPAPKLKDITQAATLPEPPELAAIYGDAVTTDPIAAKLAESEAPQRMGIFSLPAVLASHSGPTTTRPIKRGVFWGRKVMCMNMQPPPKSLHIDLDEIDHATERQRIEQTTKRAACAGCHNVINPLGFFQESYDAIGKWRTEENGKPVDSSVLINFLGQGPPRKTETPAEAIKVLTNSNMFKQCFVRQLFRFYMGRNEETSDDPVLRQMFLKFVNSDQDILKTVYVLTSSDRLMRPQ